MPVDDPEIRPAYVFNLHLLCGGYAYFSTFSRYVAKGENGRETRVPDQVNSLVYARLLFSLEARVRWLGSDADIDYWLYRRGWAFVEPDAAHSRLHHWLRQCECIRDPFNSYTDVAIASTAARSRQLSGRRKARVRKRDRGQCLECGRRGEEEHS